MRETVRVGGVIRAEAATIFSCLSDYKQAPMFIDGLQTLTPTSDQTAGEGALFEAVMKVGPKVFNATIELSAVQADRLVTWSSATTDGQSVTFKLAPDDNGTKVVLEIGYEKPTGLTGTLTAPIIEETVRAHAHASMRRLRDHVT